MTGPVDVLRVHFRVFLLCSLSHGLYNGLHNFINPIYVY
jgi:hypothetical protein